MEKVSCYCSTYNRPPNCQWLVEEAIESFLRQDYPCKELIVLNDCPAQELICDVPGVLVFNAPARFHSTGEKFNAAIGFANGDVLAPWDDDDIALPWRLSLSLEKLGNADYYNPSRYWLWDSRGLHWDHQMSLGWGCSMFTRSSFAAVGGFPHISGEADETIDRKFRAHPGVRIAPSSPLRPDEWYYVYRWGVSPAHISGKRPYGDWYAEIGRRPVERGRFVLLPHWKQDYVKITRDASSSAFQQVSVAAM